MKIYLSDENDKDDLYDHLIVVCEEIKLVMGPEGLASTLRRHKSLNNFLIEHQRDYLKFLEEKIDKLK